MGRGWEEDMRTYLSAALLLSLAAASYGAQPDCQAGERYLAAARDKSAASDFNEAADLAQSAVDACPSYGGYELLGESRAQSLSRPDHVRAVDAFVSAHELASSDTERARTLYQYARLLNLDGDPQNAYPLIKDAKGLDPGNADIAALARKIEQRINNPTKEQIVRGLWDSMYKPLRVASIKTAHSTAESAPASTPASVPTSNVASVSIPINFELGTTMVDERTRANIAVLAEALADPTYTQQHFTFVGHADVRGVEPNNIVLSKRRAEAMAQAVVLLQPSLQGRIDIIGRGSSEPIDPGHDEDAYRTNRRLQVLLK
jgi:outer membrane protein OmpA-like peptidoglycan-associated protein